MSAYRTPDPPDDEPTRPSMRFGDLEPMPLPIHPLWKALLMLFALDDSESAT